MAAALSPQLGMPKMEALRATCHATCAVAAERAWSWRASLQPPPPESAPRTAAPRLPPPPSACAAAAADERRRDASRVKCCHTRSVKLQGGGEISIQVYCDS